MNTLPVADILRQKDQPLSVSGLYTYEEIPGQDNVHSTVSIQLNATGFRVHGTIQARPRFECDRCLASFTEPVEIRVDEQYVFRRIAPAAARRDQEVQMDGLYEEIDEDGELDLKDLIRQCLLVETNTQHVCGREECRVYCVEAP